MRRFVLSPLLALALLASVASAEVHQATIPLHEGRLRSEDLTISLLKKFHLPGIGWGSYSLDISDLEGSDFVTAINQSLGKGAHVDVNKKALTLSVDPSNLPADCDSVKQAVRVFTEDLAPSATADQQKLWGLFMPKEIDPARRMIVLVHGLDCNRSNWAPMADMLTREGYQIAYFTYPSDGPIETSVNMLAKEVNTLHHDYPKMPLSIIAHSMGGLVARAYIEGPDYSANIDHLIMLGTPNQGSRWAAYRMALEVREHYGLWKSEPKWRLSWMITDGLGEAGRDLKPKSHFLTDLNARPRNSSVHYTIIAGDQNAARTIEADTLDGTANIIPQRARSWWGLRQINTSLHNAAQSTRETCGKSDGPVTLASTRLQGVSDHVIVHADHMNMYIPTGPTPPPAWATIRDRLALASR
jgi:pimeloyl-ACP methyl ester carboxylesterase